jgi:hypothetical protein
MLRAPRPSASNVARRAGLASAANTLSRSALPSGALVSRYAVRNAPM